MILRIAAIYQRAGMSVDTHCRTTGMLSMGNISPEKIIVGAISAIPEESMAAT